MDPLSFASPDVIPKLFNNEDVDTQNKDNTENNQREEDISDDWPYYALFNVEKNCQLAEIRERYRHLSLKFHPDKSPPELREAAQEKFREIQEAYCVLSDPRQRKLYDTIGKHSFSIPTSVIRSNNIAEETRKYNLKINKELVESQIGIENEVTLSFARSTLSGSALKSTWYVPESPFYIACTLGVKSMAAKTTRGNMVSLGSHSITAGYKGCPMPGLDLNVEVTPAPYPSALVKSTYSFDNDTFCSVSSQINQASCPPVQFTMGRRLWQHTSGYLTLVTPTSISYSSFTMGLSNPKWNSSMTVGKTDIALALSKQFYLHSEGPAGRNTLKIGSQMALSSGLVGYLSLKSRLTDRTSVVSSLNISINGTMTLKFKIERLKQKIIVPIFLGRLNGVSIVVVCCAATSASLLLDYYLLAPKQTKSEQEYVLPKFFNTLLTTQRRLKDLRYEHAEEISISENAAKEEIKILEKNLDSQLEVEKRKDGLIIVSAIYSSSLDHTSMQDVRIPLQSLVINSQLRIPSGASKSHLVGFYDPAYGERKILKVVYRFGGRLHEVVVKDRESLNIPMRKDRVDKNEEKNALNT